MTVAMLMSANLFQRLSRVGKSMLQIREGEAIDVERRPLVQRTRADDSFANLPTVESVAKL
jgi:hypothetical protein